MSSKRWKQEGTVCVDAGMIWIGDPCYFVRDKRFSGEDKKPYPPLNNYKSLCKKLDTPHLAYYGEEP